MSIVCQISNSPTDKLRDYLSGLQLDQLPNFQEAEAKGYKLIFVAEEYSLSLLSTELGEKSPLSIDLVGGAMGHRRAFSGGKKQDICRAVGLNRTKNLSLADATTGLGRDAFVLACQGAEVTGYEINSILYSMLSWARAEAKRISLEKGVTELTAVLERLDFVQSDSCLQLKPSSFDVVYLDPMFPQREKSAKVKKEMQILQQLLPDAASDPDVLFQSCWAAAKYRVVIKRPIKAPLFIKQKPTHQICGKTVRYDVYVKAALPI